MDKVDFVLLCRCSKREQYGAFMATLLAILPCAWLLATHGIHAQALGIIISLRVLVHAGTYGLAAEKRRQLLLRLQRLYAPLKRVEFYPGKWHLVEGVVAIIMLLAHIGELMYLIYHV
jgi:hypothetical protein